MFDINSGRIKPAGIIEFLFFIIEATLVAGFIFSSASSIFVYFESATLIIFLLSYIPSSIKIHGKISTSDSIFVLIGLIVLIGLLSYSPTTLTL